MFIFISSFLNCTKKNFFFQQVNSRASCNEMFSEEKLAQLKIPIFRKRQQLPHGITNEISCVGNEITVGVSTKIILLKYTLTRNFILLVRFFGRKKEKKFIFWNACASSKLLQKIPQYSHLYYYLWLLWILCMCLNNLLTSEYGLPHSLHL